MRLATLVVFLVACNDLRGFQGTWHGPRVGDSPALRVGVTPDATATLEIDGIDAHGIRGKLGVDGLVDAAEFVSIAGAEADVLSGMTFGGSPLRVYLAFVPISDGGGDALLVLALYDDRRVEARVLRGGTAPVYAIFALGAGP